MSLKLSTPKFRFHFPKKKKGLTFGVLALLLLLAVVLARTALPISTKILTVHPEEFVKSFTEEAQVVPLNEWTIYNAVDGKIATLNVQNGDKVAKGQLLAELGTEDLNHQLDGLKAQLTSLEGQRQQNNHPPLTALVQQTTLIIEQAETDYQAEEQAVTRTKALYEAGAIPLTQYEEAQHQAEKAKNFLEQQKNALQLLYEQQKPVPGTDLYFSGQEEALKAQIAQLEEKIEKSKLLAPQDGIIKDLTLKPGELVPAGQPVLTLFQNQGYRLESYILAKDVQDIKLGGPVKMLQDTSTGNKTWTGKIETIAPSAVERTSPLGLKENRVKVTVLPDTTLAIVPGSSLDIQFITQQSTNRLLVPKTALFPYQNGQGVWIVQNGKAALRAVTVGMENDKSSVIEKGLEDGDQIVLDPEIKGLKEGKAVKGTES